MSDFIVTEPGIYHDVPEDTYHADPVPEGSLSVSGAKVLLPPGTPEKYHWTRTHPEKKDAFDFGTAAHSLVLQGEEAYQATVKVLPFDDWRTKDAQTKKAEAVAAGLVPLLTKDDEKVRAMAAKLREHKEAMETFDMSRGAAEVSAFRRDPETGVWLRSRFDYLGDEIIGDYKTTTSCDPGHFSRDAAKFRYHMQQAWYEDMAVGLGLIERPRFRFVAQEKEAPYAVNVIVLDDFGVRTGRALNREAIDIYSQCVTFDDWPGHRGVTTVALPSWAQYEADIA
jgi:hypothetical protein